MTLKSIDNRKASVSKLKNSQDRNLATEQSFYTTKLTEKQKKFVSLIAGDLSLIEAYEQAYETSSTKKVMSISANALMKNPKILRAIELKKVEHQASKTIALEQQKLHMHLANELMELSKKVEDEKIRLRILEMLFEISKKITY